MSEDAQTAGALLQEAALPMPALSEAARLHALHQLGLIDSRPSDSFDRITRMAGQIFSLDISAVSLTDTDRQWFLSRLGVAGTSLPRTGAPCAEVTQTSDQVVIPDLLAHPAYRDSPLAATGARFYAGVPLTTREGHCLGALCVVGTAPRTTTPTEMSALDDLAAMVMAQIELRHAYGRIDPISGLPNRNQFVEDLRDAARDCSGEARTVVLVDLAQHSELDTVGRAMGPAHLDVIVRSAVLALAEALPLGCTAYHVAATQFAFMLPADEDEQLLARVGAGLAAITLDADIGFATTLALGVAPFVLGEVSPQDVLRTGYSAAQDSRASERVVSIYSSASDDAHRRRYTLLTDFAAALQRPDQLHLVYQPRIELASGRCIGAEALLRWRHPVLGDISPAEFIPIVEQTSLVRATLSWVLDKTMRQQATWRSRGLDLCLSINVSAANLRETDLAERVQLLLLKHRLRPEWIELELTESAIMDRSGSARDQLIALSEAGVALAIDDFGTGYSSLSYLQKLPVRTVKIDQSFVRMLKTDTREHALVRAMITLSHDLGYRVVAEGVETLAALEPLLAMRCDEAQGYFFSRPLTAAVFETWLSYRRLEAHRAA